MALLDKTCTSAVGGRPVVKHRSRLVMSAERGYKRNLKSYFANRGVTYEKDNSFHPRLAQKLVESVPLTIGDSVLDVATGTGYVAICAAAKVGKSGAVLGVDISSTMLIQVCLLLQVVCQAFMQIQMS